MFKFIPFLILFTSCTSVNRVSDKTYEVTCGKFVGGCEAEIEKTCPTGHKVTSKDWSYGFGGAKDSIYFECTEK